MRRRRRCSPLPPRAAPGDQVARAGGVGVRHGTRWVLRGVDLAVHAGELVALVGPNGAGKSTLLGLLAGDRPADEGAVHLHGRALTAWSPVELARLRAVLPQQSTLSFPFTVGDVVRMGRAPWIGTAAAASDDAAVTQALQQTDTAVFAERRFPSLSGGERARAALARVLAQQAGLLLLDEPTAALDLRHQELVMRMARQRARAGYAVVVVLHDLGLAGAHADRVVLLAGGLLHASGTPAQVLTPAVLETAYGVEVEVLTHPRTGHPMVLPRR